MDEITCMKSDVYPNVRTFPAAMGENTGRDITHTTNRTFPAAMGKNMGRAITITSHIPPTAMGGYMDVADSVTPAWAPREGPVAKKCMRLAPKNTSRQFTNPRYIYGTNPAKWRGARTLIALKLVANTAKCTHLQTTVIYDTVAVKRQTHAHIEIKSLKEKPDTK